MTQMCCFGGGQPLADGGNKEPVLMSFAVLHIVIKITFGA